jgi:restriction endonuclease S subunit
MKLRVSYYIICVLIVLTILSCGTTKKEKEKLFEAKKQLAESYQKGRRDAQKDLSEGFKIKRWGMPPYGKYEKHLREKYNIKIEVVSGYFCSNKELHYISGYNDVMKKAIKEKYGKDFFERINADVLSKN